MVSHRYQTCSVTRARKNVIPFNLLSLPDDLITEVLVQVCHYDIRDVDRLKFTRKTLKRMSKDNTFFKLIDLINMNCPWISVEDVAVFYGNCYQAGNILAIMRKGVSDFLFAGRRYERIAAIKQAADAGLDIAKYSYGMIRVSFAEDGDMNRLGAYEFSRETALQLRNKLEHLGGSTWTATPPLLEAKIQEIDASSGPNCRKCAIPPPYNWRVSGCKMADKWCDECFWLEQTNWFCMLLTQNFRAWHDN